MTQRIYIRYDRFHLCRSAYRPIVCSTFATTNEQAGYEAERGATAPWQFLAEYKHLHERGVVLGYSALHLLICAFLSHHDQSYYLIIKRLLDEPFYTTANCWRYFKTPSDLIEIKS